MSGVDADFTALPLEASADAALEVARRLGATHADLRVQRGRTMGIQARDGRLAGSSDDLDSGLAVRVLVDGVWGFAATGTVSADAAAGAAEAAVELARVSRPLATQRVELADEPVHTAGEYVSPYARDPFTVPSAEREALLTGWTARLMAAGVAHADASVHVFKEQKYYADLAGTSTLQQRVLIDPSVEVAVLSEDGSDLETMASLVPPSARGWEYVQGEGWDFGSELARLPELVAEKLRAPSVDGGTYDLLIDPTNLWLTIHESVGHATELDRALGYEAAYAGTSFATFDQLGTLRYGSDLMTVTGDRTTPHGCATTGWDDEGVATRSWDLVRDGVLVGYQLDRRIAHETGLGPSNGCAYAESALHVPVQRMANVSLAAAPGGPSTEDLIAGMDDGIYVVGDKSWSIDMQRYNFQFTGQRFYRVRGGRLAGMVRDVAYQASTPAFWGSLAALGGPQTYLLGGAANCGKAQPGQVAWVSHGCPSALFSGVNVLNAKQEAGR